MSEEDDIVFTDIIIPENKIIIWMPEEILSEKFGNDKENVQTLWRTTRAKIYGKKKIEPLEVLELAREVFHEDDVKDKVVIDISEIEAWKLCPTNPHGFCTVNVQGIVVGNVGFFVSLDAISKKLIKILAKMGDEDRKAYLESFKQLIKNTTDLEPKHKKPFIKMLQEIIKDLM